MSCVLPYISVGSCHDCDSFSCCCRAIPTGRGRFAGARAAGSVVAAVELTAAAAETARRDRFDKAVAEGQYERKTKRYRRRAHCSLGAHPQHCRQGVNN